MASGDSIVVSVLCEQYLKELSYEKLVNKNSFSLLKRINYLFDILYQCFLQILCQ